MDTEALEAKLAEHSVKAKTKLFSCVYYTIPTYHNPSGILFTDAVNNKLIQLARKFDALIVCDDVYNLLVSSLKKLKYANLILISSSITPSRHLKDCSLTTRSMMMISRATLFRMEHFPSSYLLESGSI